MQAILHLSDQASACLIPKQALLPLPIAAAVHFMQRAHWLWRWKWQITEVYANTRNLKLLIAGHIARRTIGDSLFLRVAGQVVLVASRILELGKQKMRTYEAYCALASVLTTQENCLAPIQVPRHRPSLALTLLGEDHYIWLVKRQQAWIIFLRRVASYSFVLFKEMGKTSLCYMDVIEAFSCNATVRHDAINHLFINTAKLLDGICENKQTIHAELLRHKALIKHILCAMGTQYTAEHFISDVAKTLSRTEQTYNGIQAVLGCCEAGFKEGLSALSLSALGWVPAFLLSDPKSASTIFTRA